MPTERDPIRTMLALARFERQDLLHKSASGTRRQQPKLALDPKKASTPQPSKDLQIGDYLRVQRPGLHQEKILARLLAVGKDGVTVADQRGQKVRVRHDHIVERHAQPSGAERAAFARALHSQGVPVPLEDRFLRLDPQGRPARRVSTSQIALMERLASYGIPVDVARIREEATYAEAEELLSDYVTDPDGRIGTVSKKSS